MNNFVKKSLKRTFDGYKNGYVQGQIEKKKSMLQIMYLTKDKQR